MTVYPKRRQVLDQFDRRKNIHYKCQSCKREWTAHNFRDTHCVFCRSDKVCEKR